MKPFNAFKELTGFVSRRHFMAWGAGALASLYAYPILGGTVSKGSTTVILGGGFGGIATARTLRQLLPVDHKIILIDKSATFQIGATKTWVMLGQAEPGRVVRSLDALTPHGIEVRQSDVKRIDLAKKEIETEDGSLRPDYLVIALGADVEMAGVPGLADAGETFYTREGAIRLRRILGDFTGGRIVLLIPRTPFKCPPGPYEAAMMLRSYLHERKIDQRSSIDIYTVEKAPMSTAGPEIGKYIIERLKERAIGFHPQSDVQSVDGAGRAVVLADGSRIPYDLLIAIPPHVGPRAVRESGLVSASGWIPADPGSLEVANSPHPNQIFAIGDVASVPLPGRFNPEMPLVLPKAGVFAERQGITVAGRIASDILERDLADEFDGKGFCYIELGGGQALRGDGSFYNMPNPIMLPGPANDSQLTEKKAWVDSWMAKYL
ncbi:MAG: NAD(P)/FAD-dependent oxidoreductase [candidate division Zixibacteria bacterium]|nr:NAD(P)/FAD-dependent oxidoreductase [candidate division Zixibacteria bacterium]